MKNMNNKNKNINDLIDKGWGEMSKLLDERLPVYIEKSNRDKLKLAVSLIIFLVVFLGILLMNTKRNKNIVKITGEKNRTYLKNSNEFADFKNGLYDFSVDANLMNKIDNSNLMQPKDKTEIIGKSNITDNTIFRNNKKYTAIHENLKEKIKDIGQIIIEPKNDFLDYNTNRHEEEFLFTNNLNINSLVYCRIPVYIKDFVPVVSMVKHKVKEENTLSIEAAIVSENAQSFGGAEFSILYNYNLAGNLNLSSGVNISYLNKKRMANSFFRTYHLKDPLLNYNTENMDIESYLANFKSPVLRSIFIDKLIYIGIPVTLSFGRGKVKYNIGAKVAYLVSGTNYISKNEYHFGYNFVINSPYEFYNSNIYNKLDYGLKIGIDYNLTSKLSLSYYVNYSFSWIINSPNYQDLNFYPGALIVRYNEENRYDKNFYFGLGLKYQLMSK